ncbi:hypothetical protein EON80_11805 [bacterium]|nr:MAG: hypothetical protein EON80_11805 [bacterium]
MATNFTRLTKRVDCQSLIEIISKEKENLEFRKLSLERRIRSTEENSIELEMEFQKLAVELSSWTTIADSLPDGAAKDNAIIEKKKIEYKLLFLEDRKNNYGAVVQCEKDYDVECIDAQIAKADVFIAAVQQHQATLPS